MQNKFQDIYMYILRVCVYVASYLRVRSVIFLRMHGHLLKLYEQRMSHFLFQMWAVRLQHTCVANLACVSPSLYDTVTSHERRLKISSCCRARLCRLPRTYTPLHSSIGWSAATLCPSRACSHWLAHPSLKYYVVPPFVPDTIPWSALTRMSHLGTCLPRMHGKSAVLKACDLQCRSPP